MGAAAATAAARRTISAAASIHPFPTSFGPWCRIPERWTRADECLLVQPERVQVELREVRQPNHPTVLELGLVTVAVVGAEVTARAHHRRPPPRVGLDREEEVVDEVDVDSGAERELVPITAVLHPPASDGTFPLRADGVLRDAVIHLQELQLLPEDGWCRACRLGERGDADDAAEARKLWVASAFLAGSVPGTVPGSPTSFVFFWVEKTPYSYFLS